MRKLAWLLAVVGCSGSQASHAPVDRPTFEGDTDGDAVVLSDGVVIQPRLQALYFPEQRGRIVSVELASGGSRWGSIAGVKPLFVRDGKLLAQQAAARDGGALGLVALDTDTGELATDVAPIPLPDGVTASLGGGFVVWALDVDGEVRVRWRAGDPAAAQAGAARVDLGSGEVREDSAAASDEREPPPRAPPPNPTSYEVASADRRHLMRVEKLPGGAPLYAWSISSLDTGEQVAQLTVAEPAFAFYVHGPVIIAPSPTHVRALALEGGEEVWRWAMLRAER